MYIVCAPDSFKGSMTAPEAAAAMAEGIRQVFPEATIIEVPIADGGEGFAEAVAAAIAAPTVWTEVHDQRGRVHQAFFALDDSGQPNRAILDVAATSGLDLVPAGERDVMTFDTCGLGELMLAAIEAGAGRLTIGIGGSSTNDAGAGMLAALGARFLDAAGGELRPNPSELAQLAAVDLSGLDARLGEVVIDVACDVTNPLLGPEGAAAVYGPQKGASPKQVAELDRILAHLVDICGEDAAKAAELPGSGAAGGLGWALRYFLGADLRPGFELVSELVGLDEHLAQADLVLGAEGSVDAQTPHGKAVARLCEHAQAAGVPVLVFGGRVALDAAKLPGEVVDIIAITPPGQPLEEALRAGRTNLQAAVAEAVAKGAWA